MGSIAKGQRADRFFSEAYCEGSSLARTATPSATMTQGLELQTPEPAFTIPATQRDVPVLTDRSRRGVGTIAEESREIVGRGANL